MKKLCNVAHKWSEDQGQEQKTERSTKVPRTGAYVDLIFAYGMARLGDNDTSRDLMTRASAVLDQEDDVHDLMLEAYKYRIQQALDGKAAEGPLPVHLMELLEELKKQRALNKINPDYIVDRLRSISRIVEPHQKVAPYRFISARNNERERLLAELSDLLDRQKVADQVHLLLRDLPKANRAEEKAKILHEALNQAPRVGEQFALEMLALLPASFDELREPQDQQEFEKQTALLGRGMWVAAHFDRAETVHQLVNRFQKLLQSQHGGPAFQMTDSLTRQCFRGLRKLGMRNEIDQMLRQMAELLLEGRDLTALSPDAAAKKPAVLVNLLELAGEWYYFSKNSQADFVVNVAREVLFLHKLSPQDRVKLACAYATALGQGPQGPAQQRLEELFRRLSGIRGTYTTNDYYSWCQLQLTEAVVLAVVSEDFCQGAGARRWLDEDEFLVRRRVHRDLRAAMSQIGG
jgi:cellulose synthase operon protein C